MKELLGNLKAVFFDFDGVFTDNRVMVNEKGEEAVFCHRSDGLGLDLLRKLDLQMAIISTEPNPVVQHRAKKLKIECHSGVSEKGELLLELLKQKKIDPAYVAYVGNDVNDLTCLKVVGLPVVVSDAWPEAKRVAKIVLESKGGHGAVREFCEMIDVVKRN